MPAINLNPQTLTDLQTEVLIGTLLGDASLSIRKQCISPRLTIRRQLRDIEYIKWQKEIFHNLCSVNAVTTGSTFDKRYNKDYPYCNLESRYIPAFKQFHKDWYGNGKKEVPRNFKLTQMICAVWLCDDGCVKIYSSSKKRIKIELFTQGFKKDCVDHLKDMLNLTLGSEFITYQLKNKEQYYIVGYDSSARKYLEYIDNVFPESMKRKSDIWRNESVCFYENKPPESALKFPKERREKVLKLLEEKPGSTLKEICLELGYFCNIKNKIYLTSSVVLFVKKLFDEGKVYTNDIYVNKFRINYKLFKKN